MHFIQKSYLYNRAEFRFEDKNLKVTIDDGRLKIGFTAPYHEIGAKRFIKSFSEKAVFSLAMALMLAAVTGYIVTFGDMAKIQSLVFRALFAASLVLFISSRYARFDAICIPVASGHTIVVFHDAKHQAILSEIFKRRKSEILRLYGEVDGLNDAKLELKKFLWLKEEGIISDEELEEARLKIAVLSQKPSRHS